MALTTDPLLITKADIDKIRPSSVNIDTTTRLDPYILESQQIEMQDILGEELYTTMVNDWDGASDFTLDRFKDLWNGVEYTKSGKTVRMYGLNYVVAYYTYARFLYNQNLVVSRFGVKSKTNDNSEEKLNSEIRTKADKAKSMALKFTGQVNDFLLEKSGEYPEWRPIVGVRRKTSYQFSRV